MRLLEMGAHVDATDGRESKSIFHRLLEDSRAGEFRQVYHCRVI